jgi:hypothetical protein
MDIIAECNVNPLKVRIVAAILQIDKLTPDTFDLLFSKQDQRIIKTWVLRHKGRSGKRGTLDFGERWENPSCPYIATYTCSSSSFYMLKLNSEYYWQGSDRRHCACWFLHVSTIL